MILKIAAGMMGIGLLAAGIMIWSLMGDLEDREHEVEVLNANLVACNLSNKNLATSIDSQNEKIDDFNTILNKKNIELTNIEITNNTLQKKLEEDIYILNQIDNKTCEETMQWMLKEALNEEISDNNSN